MQRSHFAIKFSGFLLAFACYLPAWGQTAAHPAQHAATKHRVVFQVSDDDPKKWNLTLNNVANVQKDLGKENVEIEVVAFGPGIGMLKLDSNVGRRIKDALDSNVKVVACQNTMRGQHLTQEDMLSEIGYVPAGVVEVIKKQEAGYAYLKP